MPNQNLNTEPLWILVKGLFTITLFICLFLLAYYPLRESINNAFHPKYTKEELKEMTSARTAARSTAYDKVENGIHLQTGMVYDENFNLVRATCTSCHSAKLITQNRADRSGWKQMILWMQESQGLPDLGSAESKILDYLAKHYAPQKTGRRENLKNVEWYVLEMN